MRINTEDLDDLIKHTNTPIFAYCRKLVKEGYNPEEYLEIYRKHESWNFRVKIGDGASWTVDEESTPRFVKFKGYKGPHRLPQ